MLSTRINPFKPSAGHLPPVLIGRDMVLADFEEGLDNGSGAPGRLMRITGARGVGKTVMLAEFRRIAEKRGWQTISETASDGMAQRLVDKLQPRKGNFSFSFEPSISVMNVGGSLGGVHYEKNRMPLTLRETMSLRLDELEKHGNGLLVTMDEAQAATRADMVAIATAVQHLTSEDRNLAFVFAGLPSMSSKWLNDSVMTFLRRRATGAVERRRSGRSLSCVGGHIPGNRNDSRRGALADRYTSNCRLSFHDSACRLSYLANHRSESQARHSHYRLSGRC